MLKGICVPAILRPKIYPSADIDARVLWTIFQQSRTILKTIFCLFLAWNSFMHSDIQSHMAFLQALPLAHAPPRVLPLTHAVI
jgi:hypothetical protein